MGDITCKDWLLAIAGAFLGSLGGLAIAVFIEWLKRPKISIKVALPSDQEPGHVPTRFLHCTVSNQPLSRWLGPFLAREPALSCYARIEFLRLDGSAVFARPMDVRWTGSPQPPSLMNDGVLHWSSIDALRFRDIYPNRSEGIDIAAKFGGESECYGFTNTSYLTGLKQADWKLTPDRFRLRISVFAGDRVLTKQFILRNDWPRKDFCLQEDDV